MKMPFRNKRAQFGPDALVGMVLVAILGLGGVFFLNTFVNGLALQGLLSILDKEIDQRCFYMLLPLMNDEYVRTGATQSNLGIDLGGTKPFITQQNYFGGYDDNMEVSSEFADIVQSFNTSVHDIKGFPLTITGVSGYIANREKAGTIRGDLVKDFKPGSRICQIPVYSPAGRPGMAEIFLSEEGE